MRPREAAISEIHGLLQEAQQLRLRLRSCEAAYRRTLKQLEGGRPVSTTLKSVQPGDVRDSLNTALATFERTRHRSRLSLIASSLEEGMTIGEVGRTWGFSRQLASRYAKEAREVVGWKRRIRQGRA